MQNPNKTKIDYLGWGTLLTIIFTTTFISYQLSKLRTEFKVQSITKVQVTNNDQLKKLCTQFKNQWKADKYAIYIYQPNSPVKTHKELASSDIQNMTLRLPLSDYRELSQNRIEFGSVSKLKIFNNQAGKLGESYIRIPIYQYSVIVAEFYLFYDQTSSINSSSFDSMIVETQIINQLFK